MQIRSIITVILASAFILLGMIAEAVDNSLVLYFTFDEDQGDAVTDLSSYHNDGIMKGDPDQVEGIFGSALLFDGATTSVEVPHSASLSITEAITLEMWVNLPNDGINANNVGIEKGGWEPGEYSLYAFYVPGNGSAMQFMDLPVACGDANSGNLGPNLKDDQWHHIAGTWEGTTISIYTDGELSIEFGCKGGLQTNNKSVFIGARNGAERFLKGVVDEVRIYNRALSQDEIKKDMETLGGLAVSPSGRIAALWGQVKRAYH